MSMYRADGLPVLRSAWPICGCPMKKTPSGTMNFPYSTSSARRPPPYGSASLMTETMRSEKPYPIKAFISSGSNPALTFPDTKLFLEGIKNLELFVNIDPNMTETGQLADYVLPACTFLEETGIGGFPYGISYCEPYIMLRKKVVEPLYESKPIWLIWTELGRKMGYAEHFPWNTDEEVAEHFFSTSGVTVKDLMDHPEGVYFGKKEYKLYEKVGFGTASGKIEIYSPRMEELGYPGLPGHVEPQQSPVADPEIVKEYPEILLTGVRQIEYIDAQMRDVPALRARRPDAEAEIHPATAGKYGIVHGEMIGVETPRGSIKIKANVTAGHQARGRIGASRLGGSELQYTPGRHIKGSCFRLHHDEQRCLPRRKAANLVQRIRGKQRFAPGRVAIVSEHGDQCNKVPAARPAGYSSQHTESPTDISPPSITSPYAPPSQCPCIAPLNPSSVSSILPHGFVSPYILIRQEPTRRILPRLLFSRIPLTIRFARRALGGCEPPTRFINSSQTSCSIMVTCLLPPWSALPAMPSPATSFAEGAGSIGPRFIFLIQIACSFPLSTASHYASTSGASNINMRSRYLPWCKAYKNCCAESMRRDGKVVIRGHALLSWKLNNQ